MNIRIFFLISFILEIFAETGFGLKKVVFTGFSIKNLLLLLLLVAIFTTGNKLERRKRFFYSKGIHKYYLLYMAVLIITTILAHISGNFTDNYNITDVVIAIKSSIVDPYLVFLIFLLYPKDKHEIEKLIKLFTAIIVVLAAMTVIASVISLGFFFGLDNDVTRPNGPFGEPNQTASVLSMILLITISPLIRYEQFSFVRLISSIILLSCILVTGSRGGFLAASLGIAYFLFSMRKYLSVEKKIMILIFGIFGVIFTWIMLPEHVRALVISRFGVFDTSHIDWKEASAGRTMLWLDALKLWLKSPIYGYGWLGYVMRVGSPTHNSFLEVLVSAGPLGLLFYILLVKNILSIFNIKDKLYSVENIVILKGFRASIIAIFIAVFFVNLFIPWLIVWAMIGLMVGYSFYLVKHNNIDQKAVLIQSEKKDKRILSLKRN